MTEPGAPAVSADPGLGIAPLDAIARRPRLAALAGALCIAFSGIFYLWADVTPSTGTVFRALFGLPLLAAVALAERRRYGPLPTKFGGRVKFLSYVARPLSSGCANFRIDPSCRGK